jgi:16S rRNA G966 N2-methylase RsmD
MMEIRKTLKHKSNTLFAIAAILFMILIVTFSGCSSLSPFNESSQVKKKEMQFSDFTAVEVKDAFEVEIAQSNKYSVTVIADNDLYNNLKVRHQNDTLQIYIDPPYTHIISNKKVLITMPDIQKLDLSMNSKGTITGFQSLKDLVINLSLGSSLSGDFEADNVICNIASGSHATLVGNAQELILDASAGSSAECSKFELTRASIKLNSGSKATVNVKESMSVDLKLGSNLSYIGDPTVTKMEISGGSTMKAR